MVFGASDLIDQVFGVEKDLFYGRRVHGLIFVIIACHRKRSPKNTAIICESKIERGAIYCNDKCE
jgi:hypothetical protein